MLFNTIIPKNVIIMEAKKSKINIKPEVDSEDYTDDTDIDDDEDYTDTSDDDSTETTETEADVDPETEDEDEDTTNEDDDTDESTDYSDDKTVDDTSDDTTSSDDTTDTPEDDDTISDNKKNLVLIKDFISLHNMVLNSITKLSDIRKSDLLSSTIILQVIKNLSIMENQIFDYIQTIFDTNKYINNLYEYNYFIEAYKINLEILKKIKSLNKV